MTGGRAGVAKSRIGFLAMVFWGLLYPYGVVAQSEVGLSFGVTHSRGAGDEGDPTETRSAFYARAFVDTYFTDFFSVQVNFQAAFTIWG